MTFGWELGIIKKLPIPYYKELIRIMNEENKPQEEQQEINDVSELAKFAKKLK